MDKLFDLWAKRNPEWEKRFADNIMNTFSDYGKGTSQYLSSRGKIFGAGYELFILAFFIGLYFDKTKKLDEDKTKRKPYGQAIQYWGNIEQRLGRQQYGNIRKYMFIALIAKTDIDLIALEKGDPAVTPRKVVDVLVDKMEQYANFGFYFMEEKLGDDPNYFFKENAFFKVIFDFIQTKADDMQDDELESLD